MINISGFRGMAVETKVNNCRRFLGDCAGMKRPNGANDEKNLGYEGSRRESIFVW